MRRELVEKSLFFRDGDRTFFEREEFPWVSEIEAEWKTIRKELDALMVHREEIPNFQERVHGGDKAIQAFKSRHADGKLVGENGQAVYEFLESLKWVRVGSKYIEFEWHSEHGEDHPTATVVVDLSNGRIADVVFSTLCW